MIRPATYLSISAPLIVILVFGCGLEESYIPEPTKSTATEPAEAAPDPVAVAKSDGRSPSGYLPAGPSAANRAGPADVRDNEVPGDTVRRPSPPPNRRYGPQTAEASRRLLAQLGGRAKIDLTSGKVVIVFLNRTDIDDFDLQLLQNLTDVQVLNLTGTRVSDKGLVYLYQLKKLRRIYTQGTRITEEGLRSLQAKLPKLRVMMFRSDVPTP